jgi:hypothetical protein
MKTTEDAGGAGGLGRWVPITGVVFVLLMVVRSFAVARVPNSAASPLNLVAAGGGR